MSESWTFICVSLLVFMSVENIWITLNERQWSRCLWHMNPPYRSFLAMIILSQLLESIPLSLWHFNRRQIQVIINRYKPFSPKWFVLATSSCWQALFQKFVNIILEHLIFPPLCKVEPASGFCSIKFKTASLKCVFNYILGCERWKYIAI